MPEMTALQNTCCLQTPDAVLNQAFAYAKDNIARCQRYYSLGWGMSNAPHVYALVVGRDTGWMTVGADYVAPWFAPAALSVFRDRQKPNGQILEYICLETGRQNDYGLNVADNTPLYVWGVWHHWQQFGDEAFRDQYMDSMKRAADYLVREIGRDNLVRVIPKGTGCEGIGSWRNIIQGYVLAGAVTELNCLIVLALRHAGEFTGQAIYTDAAERIAGAVRENLWIGDRFLLTLSNSKDDAQVAGDMIFPVLCGVASESQTHSVLQRLRQSDFWNDRGMRTIPNSDPGYHPNKDFGLVGGSWPNLTLWFAASIARFDPDAALEAILKVARPVVEAQPVEANVHPTEFPEWFDGDTGINRGMHLSPWVAPTFVWAVMEGLLGARWKQGKPSFQPHWPKGWAEVRITGIKTNSPDDEITLTAN